MPRVLRVARVIRRAAELRWSQLLPLGLLLFVVAASGEPAVRVLRTPHGGIQPRAAVGRDGVVHIVYFEGERAKGDLYYVSSSDSGESFSQPRPVNSQAGSATAAGTIRGAQIALGADDRLHVVWNGSSIARPRGPLSPEMPPDSPHNGKPMLYSHVGEEGAFEPQRNLMRKTFALDGGATVTADSKGIVYAAWHGSSQGAPKGEGGREVWLARSGDDGKSFGAEQAISPEPVGACGCCGMRIFADSHGNLAALYRSAEDTVHRDIHLLTSVDQGQTFRGKKLHSWEIGACPMSSMSFAEGPAGVQAAWETAGQVYFSAVETETLANSAPISAPGEAKDRKHPSLAQNGRGETLLVWATVVGWGKGGQVHWQLFSPDGKPSGPEGHADELPPWSYATALANPDGNFTIIY